MGAPNIPPDDTLERVRASISADELREQVERICRSKSFEKQGHAKSVLRYLVQMALEHSIVAPTKIAHDAMGKKLFTRGDNDVRVAMNKLRKQLKTYYDKEAGEDEIWFDIPKGQYNVFWRHSPKTLLGKTEFGCWVLWSAKLTAEGAQIAAETSRRFWPHLVSVFPVFCAEGFNATLDEGKILLPDTLKMFFDSIGNYHLFITSFDRSEIRIYPLNVWLHEWARSKTSEEPKTDLAVYEFWGQSAELEGKAVVPIHQKLLNALNLPDHKPFRIELSFHPEGFIYFVLPKPLPRPVGKYNLYLLSYAPAKAQRFYYYMLVPTDKEEEFSRAMAGTEKFDPNSFGTVIASGEGDPPEGMRERLLTKYNAVLERESTA